MKEISAGRSRLLLLDGLRGFAAIAVVLLHGTETFGLPWVPANAYLAVDFFFLLSGYVLAKSFDARLRHGWLGAFVKLRFIRLYPLIFLGSSIGLVVLVCRYFVQKSLSIAEVGLDYISSLLLIPTPPLFTAHWQIYPCDQPLWSLFYEILINVAYALLAPYLTTARLAWLVFLSAIVLAITIYVRGNADFSLDYFYLGITRVAFSFFAGVLIFRMPEAGRLRGIFSMPGYSSPIIIAALMTTLLWPYRPSAGLAIISIFVIYPSILITSLSAPQPNRLTGRLFATLGLMSYPVYAVHHPFFRLVSGISFHAGGLPVRLALMMISLLLVSMLAWFLTIYYDAPCRDWLSKRLPKDDRAPPGADIRVVVV